MTTCTNNNQRNEDVYQPSSTGRYNSCWEWVASLPGDTSNTAAADNEPSIILAGSGFVTRKRGIQQGIQGIGNGVKHSASDIYQLALATRKARERHSVVSTSEGPGNNHQQQDRAAMLRNAFAAQRLDRTNSEGTYSFDSSTMDAFGGGYYNNNQDELEDSFPAAEDLLLQLGFGGPSQGLDRVPERFLQSSQMRGVDIEQFFTTQQELNDTFETGSLGYRGLTGPPTRRPSGIVARLYERMLRKSSNGPTVSSSFENPAPADCSLSLKLLPAEVLTEMAEETTPTNPPLSYYNGPLVTGGSRKSSLASSSRRSSLRRQECVDLNEEDEPVIALELCQQSEQSSGFISTRLLSSQLPTVYVTPPPSTIFSQASLDMPVTTHEIDPIISVLQLASEAYRVRLDYPPMDEQEQCDWNHNLDDVKEELRRELDKTDDLLRRLQQRLSHARSIQQSYDSSALRGVLTDMTTLLQQQQRLYRQINDPPPQPEQSSLLTSSVSCCSTQEEEEEFDNNNSSWLQLFERRLTATIRKTVRQEMRRVRRSKFIKKS